MANRGSGGLAGQCTNQGSAMLPGVLSEADLRVCEDICDLGDKPGQRIPIDESAAALLGDTGSVTRFVQQVCPGARPVRMVGFLKSEGQNWAVPWHQDRVITVVERHDVPGFTNWSCKAGVWHCEPPVELLAQLVFVRVHLDPSNGYTGGMSIAMGSHTHGVVASSDAASIAESHPEEFCAAERGDVLLLNMLTLHRSRPTTSTAQRRALRFDFAPFDLAAPLAWAYPETEKGPRPSL